MMLNKSDSLRGVHLLANVSALTKQMRLEEELRDTAQPTCICEGIFKRMFRASWQKAVDATKQAHPATGEKTRAFSDADELVLWCARHVPEHSSWQPKIISADDSSPFGAEERRAEPDGVFVNDCWVCRRCRHNNFRWTSPGSGSMPLTDVALLASFRDFEPVFTKRDSSSAKRAIHSKDCLIPPGCNYYLFEFGGKVHVAKDQPSVSLTRVELPAARKEKLMAICRKHCLEKVNVVEHPSLSFTIPEGLGEAQLKERIHSMLGDGMSKRDDGEHLHRLNECFEADWHFVKISELCHKDEENEFKFIARSRYAKVLEAFLTFAGRSDGCFIKQMDVFDFFEEIQLLERDDFLQEEGEPVVASTSLRLTLADVEALVKQATARGDSSTQSAALASHVRTAKNPRTLHKERKEAVKKLREGDAINRAQFLELCIRLCIHLHAHDLMSTKEMFIDFVDNYIDKKLLKPPLSPFPKSFLVTQEMHNVLFENATTLRRLHQAYGKSFGLLITLAQKLRLYDKSFTAKHVRSLFALSKVCPISCQERSAPSLTYEEFTEAIARLALVKRFQRQQSSLLESKKSPLVTGGALLAQSGTLTASAPTLSFGKLSGAARVASLVDKISNIDARQMAQQKSVAFAKCVEKLISLIKERMRELQEGLDALKMAKENRFAKETHEMKPPPTGEQQSGFVLFVGSCVTIVA